MTGRLTRRELLRWAGCGAATAALAACRPAPAPTAQPQPTAAGQPEATAVPEPATVAPAAGEKTRLIVTVPGPAEDLLESIKPYTDSHPEIQVDVVSSPWGEYDNKVFLLLSSGEPLALWGPWDGVNIAYHVSRGFGVDLMPYLDKDPFSTDEFYKSEPDSTIHEGKRYGWTMGSGPTVLGYNKTMFEEAGVPLPPADWADKSWTWDEFVRRCSALVKPSDDPMAAVWGFEGNWDTRYDFAFLGTDIWAPEDYQTWSPKKSLVTEEPYKWALQFHHDLIWKYKLQPNAEQASSLSSGLPKGAFIGGKAATQLCWGVLDFKGLDYELRTAPLPMSPYNTWRGVNYLGYWSMFAVPNQDAAWELFKYFYSPEALEKSVEMTLAGRWCNTTMGGIPTRKASARLWAEGAAKAAEVDVSVVEVITAGMEWNRIWPAAATTEWSEVWDKAMRPPVERVLADQMTVEAAVAEMDPAINELLAKAGQAG